MKLNSTYISRTVLAVFSLMFAPLTLAHSGDLSGGFISGLLHPLTGIDHLLIILSVGIIATYNRSDYIKGLPGVMLLALSVGAFVGISGFIHISVETGIAMTLLVTGVFLLTSATSKSVWLPLLVILTGTLHGFAHGYEAPVGLAQVSFMLAFLITSALLLKLGMLIGENIKARRNRLILPAYAGVLATTGIVLGIL